ncbi:Peptidase family U32 [Geoglobus ahangari]|uniref:Peptidase family U32 n=1 Tax=Geoglobus ahangari TaxID=113653 RepID=A0A0F7DC81_9EURY|nr:U32 family peptidase [Geoglobus ahangari]AKG92381.1 Peptidase family U32 [Geoglobus ahangari]
MQLVGLKGYSRYSDSKAFTLEEINRMDEAVVALNRVKEADELEKVCEKIRHEHVVLNELAAISRVSGKKKVTVSVGMNALNREDIRLYEELGAYAVVIPPELNHEVDGLKSKSLKIEVFGRAFVEMFYKGKCMLSAYSSGRSVKRDGECGMECARRWKVIYNGRAVAEVTFRPRLMHFSVDADLVKHETRQITKVGVMEYGAHNGNSQS